MTPTKKNNFGTAFQKSIVAAFIRDPNFFNRFRDLLTEKVVDDPDLRKIVRGVRRVSEANSGTLPTRVSLEHAVPEQRMLVKDLYSMDLRDKEYISQEVGKFCRYQAVKKAIVEIGKNIIDAKSKDEEDYDGVIGKMQEALQVGLDFSDIGEFLKDDLRARTNEYINPAQEVRVPTGMSHLDKCLGGGMGKGELAIIAAPPKCGKTSMLVNIGCGMANALNAKKVIHYSLEMKQRKVLKRYDLRIAGPVGDMLKEDAKRFSSVLDQRMGKLMSGNVLVKSYPTKSASYSTLMAHLSRCISLGFKPDAVIIDYAMIMKPERHADETRHALASCVEDCRRLAGEMDVSAWTAWQLNRDSYGMNRPGANNISESWEALMIADAIILMAQTREEREQKTIRLIMEMLREEASGVTIRCIDDRARMLIKTVEILTESVSENKDFKKMDKGDKRLEKSKELSRKLKKDKRFKQ